MPDSLAPRPPIRTLYVWAPAVVLFALATVALNLRTVRDLDTPRPSPPLSLPHHNHALVANDTLAFSWHINHFAERFEQDKKAAFAKDVCFPFPEFDCPLSFLYTGGLAKWWTGWSPVRIINLFTLVAVFLNAIGAFGFLRALGVNAPVACAGALGYMVPNFVLYAQHMGHMNYVQLQWIAFAFWALVETMRRDAGWRPAVALGLAMGLQLLSSPSFSLYLAYIAFPVFAVTLWLTTESAERPKLRPLALRGLVAVTVALVVALPYLAARFELMPSTHPVPGDGFTWSHPRDMVHPAHPSLYIGWPLLALGLPALIWCLHVRKPVGIAMLLTLVVSMACMLPDEPWRPFHLLREHAPLFDRMRVPTRFFPIVLLMLLGLIASFLSSCCEGRRGRVCWLAAGALVAALALGQWFRSPWAYGPEAVTPLGF